MVVIHNLPAPLSGRPDMANATCFPEISKIRLNHAILSQSQKRSSRSPGIPGPPVFRERIVILPGEAQSPADFRHHGRCAVRAAPSVPLRDKKFCVHQRFQVAAGEVLGHVRAYPVGRIAKPDSKSGLKERQHRPVGEPAGFRQLRKLCMHSFHFPRTAQERLRLPVMGAQAEAHPRFGVTLQMPSAAANLRQYIVVGPLIVVDILFNGRERGRYHPIIRQHGGVYASGGPSVAVREWMQHHQVQVGHGRAQQDGFDLPVVHVIQQFADKRFQPVAVYALVHHVAGAGISYAKPSGAVPTPGLPPYPTGRS